MCDLIVFKLIFHLLLFIFYGLDGIIRLVYSRLVNLIGVREVAALCSPCGREVVSTSSTHRAALSSLMRPLRSVTRILSIYWCA
jgi:hypothetical protein